MPQNTASDHNALKRTLSLPLLVFYGTGTILGAGVYVLIGKIAGIAGLYAPFAFLLAGLVATLVAFSYAELAARLPFSAGAANYVHQAFHCRGLTLAIGFGLLLSGTVSAAVMTQGFAGYLSTLLALPPEVLSLMFIALITAIALWGILASAWLTALITLIEIGGLLLVLWVTRNDIGHYMTHFPRYLPPLELAVWLPIVSASFLAFFAYLGFEDMANVAEEVKHPEKNMPRGIIAALLITTLLYGLVAMASVTALPIEQLQQSTAPFTDILKAKGTVPPALISVISLLAIANGALVQLIMGSRLLYGLARQGDIPAIFAKLLPRRKTPIVATLSMALAITLFALWLELENLARITSLVILLVFVMVSASLVVVKRQPSSYTGFNLPLAIPVLALLASLSLLLAQLF